MSEYSKNFCDLEIWTPYVKTVCERHGLTPVLSIHTGLPGTFPTFIASNKWVIKFFGPLFNGLASYETERWVNKLLMSSKHNKPQELALTSPDLITAGQLWDDLQGWVWPYLVFNYVPGVSIGEAFNQVSFESKLSLAEDLGCWAYWLHRLKPDVELSSSLDSLESYIDFIEQQRRGCSERHASWATLPPHLIAQIDSFLSSTGRLVEWGTATHLIHADLTADHILGEVECGTWRTRGIIDFGDARLGNLLYELGALHMILFKGDKHLLGAFLQGYKLSLNPDYQSLSPGQFARGVMATALLHQFNIFEDVAEIVPELNAIDTLEQLTDRLWRIQY